MQNSEASLPPVEASFEASWPPPPAVPTDEPNAYLGQTFVSSSVVMPRVLWHLDCEYLIRPLLPSVYMRLGRRLDAYAIFMATRCFIAASLILRVYLHVS